MDIILGACKLQACLLPAVSQYLIQRVNNRSRLMNNNAISRLHPPAYQSYSEANCKPLQCTMLFRGAKYIASRSVRCAMKISEIKDWV